MRSSFIVVRSFSTLVSFVSSEAILLSTFSNFLFSIPSRLFRSAESFLSFSFLRYFWLILSPLATPTLPLSRVIRGVPLHVHLTVFRDCLFALSSGSYHPVEYPLLNAVFHLVTFFEFV